MITFCAFTFSLFLSIRIASGISCVSSAENSCSGATYCTAEWFKNVTWNPTSQGCMITNIPQKNVNKWTLPTTTTARIICSSDNCNAARPSKLNLPPAPQAPGMVTCLGTYNSGGKCNATSCYVNEANNVIYSLCAFKNSEISYQLANVTGQSYCDQTVGQSIFGKLTVTTTGCYCRNANLCNNASLIASGRKAILALPKVNCSLGNVGTGEGQICLWQGTTTKGSQKVSVFRRAYSTMLNSTKPQLGCTTVYGITAGRRTANCFCASNNSNANGPTPMPSTTASSTPTTKTKTTKTSTTTTTTITTTETVPVQLTSTLAKQKSTTIANSKSSKGLGSTTTAANLGGRIWNPRYIVITSIVLLLLLHSF